MDIYKEVIYKFLDDTSTAMMEDCVNKHLDDTNKKYLKEINQIGDDEEVGDTKNTENGVVIYRDITENKIETNRDTLKKLIEELLDDQDDEVNEEKQRMKIMM